VAVTDYRGNPVRGADVTLVVVDEAVLFLSGYEMKDPLESFYTALDKSLANTSSRVYTHKTQLIIILNLFSLTLLKQAHMMGSVASFEVFVKTLTGKTITLSYAILSSQSFIFSLSQLSKICLVL
jgi:predicted enzyme involved in methoxymalonyl-ACP biosynthesis